MPTRYSAAETAQPTTKAARDSSSGSEEEFIVCVLHGDYKESAKKHVGTLNAITLHGGWTEHRWVVCEGGWPLAVVFALASVWNTALNPAEQAAVFRGACDGMLAEATPRDWIKKHIAAIDKGVGTAEFPVLSLLGRTQPTPASDTRWTNSILTQLWPEFDALGVFDIVRGSPVKLCVLHQDEDTTEAVSAAAERSRVLADFRLMGKLFANRSLNLAIQMTTHAWCGSDVTVESHPGNQAK